MECSNKWNLSKGQGHYHKNNTINKIQSKTKKEPQMLKVNFKLQLEKVLELEEFFQKYKDVFAWTYKDLKGIPLELPHHKI
jgi:hypothetical protein